MCPRRFGFLWRTHKWSAWEIKENWFQRVPATMSIMMVGKTVMPISIPAHTIHLTQQYRHCLKCEVAQQRTKEVD